jgi:hypothetical protein
MAKRQKEIPGSVLAINLEDGNYCYGRILKKGYVAFYDLRTTEIIHDLEHIAQSPVLFIAITYPYVVKKMRWLIIGCLPLEPSLQVLPPQLTLTPGKERYSIVDFFIYDPNEGVAIRGPWKEEYASYEMQVIYAPEAIEQRIRDHYAGVENVWIGLRKKHLESWRAYLKAKGEV